MKESISADLSNPASMSFFDKQSKLLATIEKSRALVSDLVKAHTQAKIQLRYPMDEYNEAKTMHQSSTMVGSTATEFEAYWGAQRPADLDSQSLPKTAKKAAGNFGLHLLTVPVDLITHRINDQTMGKVLCSKLMECNVHLEKLQIRIADKTSRILVTGDVNAGKSTFVNALLRNNLLPTDQQPCTQSFCEVIPATGEYPDNRTVRVKALRDPQNPASSQLVSLETMQIDVQNEQPLYPWYQLFVPSSLLPGETCLINNPAVRLALIDSPGLNSDIFTKAQVFARQDDLDAVVFVINSANHLTLSAYEFLERAAREKSLIFVVVNKFDEITNRDKCQRLVLQQIGKVLPLTLQHADELVHFISARHFLNSSLRGNCSPLAVNNISCLEDDINHRKSPTTKTTTTTGEIMGTNKIDELIESFEQCERALRNFLLEKRAKSKLLPAKTFLSHLLSDLDVLLEWNKLEGSKDLDQIILELEMITPCFDDLLAHDGPLRHDIYSVIADSRKQICTEGTKMLFEFVDRIERDVQTEPWQGLFQIWAFREGLMQKIEQNADKAIAKSYQSGLDSTIAGLHLVNSVALSHASPVFINSTFTFSEGQFANSFSQATGNGTLVIPRLSSWDVININEQLQRGKTWFGAATVAGAMFGYQSILGITIRMFDTVTLLRSRRLTIVLGIGAIGIGVVYLLSDVEQMVRHRIVNHCKTICNANWVTRLVQDMEAKANQILTTAGSTLISRYEEALHRQRRIRAQKDMQKCQTESLVEHFTKYHCSVRELYDQVNSINI